MNSVQQHRKSNVMAGAGMVAAVAMYFGRNAWLNLLKPTTPGE
jgi:hypothetical protein